MEDYKHKRIENLLLIQKSINKEKKMPYVYIKKKNNNNLSIGVYISTS